MHFSKTQPLKEVTEEGIVTFVSEEQFLKIPTPISVTEDGMFISFSNLQSLKTPELIVVKEQGCSNVT